MAVQVKMFRICNVVGQYRSVLFNRNTALLYQQNAGLKQSIEDKLGLPPRPKRPLTAYFRFMAQVRPTLVQKNPEANPLEIVKLIAQEWLKADISVREQLDADFKREMLDFVKERGKYEKTLTDEQREEIKKAKTEVTESKERRKLKKKMRDLGKPRKPLSPFLVFLNERKDLRGDRSFKEWQMALGKEWGSLTEQQQSPYMMQFKKKLEEYRHEMRIWEEKMIRLGNIDVVRNEALIEPKEHSTNLSRRRKGSKE